MKKKITALLCLAAMAVNSVAAMEGTTAPATAILSDTDKISENRLTDVSTIREDEISETQSDMSENETENNENILIYSEAETIESKNILKELIDEINSCNPEEVAEEDSLSELKSALKEAENVYADSDAADDIILEAVEKLKEAVKNLKYLTVCGILTNNAFSDSETETYYPELAQENPSLIIIETDAAYKYEPDSPMALTDDGKRLTDGLSSGVMTTNANVTDSSIITFDLGGEYFISGADVFSQFFYLGASATLHRNIKGFDVEVSSDGMNFKKAAHASAKTMPDEGEGNGRYDLKTSVDFPAVSGRYVRITVKCDDNSNRYTLNEIVIKGFKTPFSRDELYEALEKYSNVDASVYTAQSYDLYIKAYNEAEKIYWDKNLSGRIIYDAKIALENAYAALKTNAVVKILSGNVRTEFDRKYYSDYSLDTANLTYRYLDGSNPQIVSLDADNNKLLQGGCEELTSNSMTYGTWDNPNPAKILFDMGEECYISGVDVWEYYQGAAEGVRANTKAGWVRISVRDDGENFTQVSEIYNPKNDADYQVANCIGQDFEAAKCRYVLVVVERGDSHQITLNEVVLRGYKSGIKETAPYNFGNFEYKNEFGTRIITLDGNNQVIVSGSVKSNIASQKDVVVISAAYKNGDIVDWVFSTVNTTGYGTANFSNTLNLNMESGVELYTFVWDSIESGLALSRMKGFGTL